MTINYTSLLGLAQPVTGTEANTWGTVVNDEITALIEEAVAGGVSINVTAGNVTMTDTDGNTNQARNAILLITGTPGTTRNVVAPSSSKVYIVRNGSDSAVVIKGAATTGVSVPSGGTSVVFWNGSDFQTNESMTELIVAAGAVGTPSITTAGDLNTGIFFPAADTIAFAEGGAEAMRINSDSQVVTTAGTVSLPAITTTGDTNTGIFFPAADTIAFAKGGVEAMRIDSNANGIVTVGSLGSVGSIGTNYATVGAWNTAGGGFRIYRGTGSGTANSYFLGDSTAATLMAQEAIPLVFGTNNTERMRIDSSGNVGIGTTTPSGYGKLTVLGAGVTGHFVSNSGAGGITIYEGAAGRGSITSLNNGAAGLAFLYSTTEAMRIDSSGNVGIGTTAPNTNLQVVRSTSGAIANFTRSAGQTAVIYGDGTGVAFGNDNGSGALGNNYIYFVPASNYGIIVTNSAERMRIDSSGNVGVGTTSPKLNANVGTFFSIVGTNANGWLELGTTSTSDGLGGSLTFNNTNVVGTDKRVAQINAARAGANNSADLIFSTANAGSIAERMRIDSSGNVGIGVTPSAWVSYKSIDMIGNGGFSGYTGETNVSLNAYYSSGWKYKTTSTATLYTQYTGAHNLYSAASGTAGNAITFTQVFAIEKDKSLALQGATSQAGTGITFPATQSASSNANTLDDYEQGTWTTTFSSAVNLTGTPALDRSTYTKIGRFVYIQGRVTGYSVTTATTQTSFVMTLPINMAEITDTPSSGVYVAIAGTSNGGFLVDSTGTNANEIAFVMPAALVSSTGAMTVAISFSYIAAD